MKRLPLRNSPRRRVGGRAGFTVVEGITVLLIVAVLAALAAGAVGRFKMRSQTARCAANLRQLAFLVHAYAGDYGGFLPRALGAPRPDGTRPSWFNTLDGAGLFAVYGPEGWSGKEHSIARCPAREFKAAHTKIKSKAGYIHYGMNNCPGGLDTVSGPVKLQGIANLSQTLLIGDSDAEFWIGRIKGEALKANHLAYPHQGGMNLAFADGHIEWHRQPLPEITSTVEPPPFPWWGN